MKVFLLRKFWKKKWGNLNLRSGTRTRSGSECAQLTGTAPSAVHPPGGEVPLDLVRGVVEGAWALGAGRPGRGCGSASCQEVTLGNQCVVPVLSGGDGTNSVELLRCQRC